MLLCPCAFDASLMKLDLEENAKFVNSYMIVANEITSWKK